jgi:hypothetical protein
MSPGFEAHFVRLQAAKKTHFQPTILHLFKNITNIMCRLSTPQSSSGISLKHFT